MHVGLLMKLNYRDAGYRLKFTASLEPSPEKLQMHVEIKLWRNSRVKGQSMTEHGQFESGENLNGLQVI